MSAVSTMKNALVSTLLIASVFSGAVNAKEREYGPDGLYKEPTCDYDFRIKKSLTILGEKHPTGIKASTDKWDMEIYAAKDGAWTLVGKSKDPSAPSNQLCRLASSIDKPYDKEKWYVSYFPKAGADKPRIASAEPEKKPVLN